MVPILSSCMPNALLATPLKLDSKGAGKHAWLLGGLNDEAFQQTNMVTYGCEVHHRCFHLFVTLTTICDYAYLLKDLIIVTSQKLGMLFGPGSGGWHPVAKKQEGRDIAA